MISFDPNIRLPLWLGDRRFLLYDHVLCTVSDHGLCQLLFYDHECCHETSGQLLSSDSGRTWNTVCFAGVSDHRRGHQIYSVNRSDTSTGQLWRQFSVIDYDCVWHYTGTIHHAV